MVFPLLGLLIFAGLTVLSALLQPRPKGAKPSSLGDFNFPTAQEGRVIPIPFGTVKISGPNVVWYGDLRVDPIKKKSGGFFGLFAKKVVVGYRYFVGIQMALCHGTIDTLVKVLVDDDKTVPAQTSDLGAGRLRLTVNSPELFGGDDKEGGLTGQMDFYRGTEDQVGNDYLAAKIPSNPAPAWRGLSYAVARQMYLGNSPYIKPWAFVVRALHLNYATELGLDLSLADVGCDANPAVILYALHRNPVWGLGVPLGRFNLDSFRIAGEKLAEECMGMSLLVDSASEAQEVMHDILRHVDGVLYADPETGLLTFELIRADYDVEETLHLTDDDVLQAPECTRISWEETRNEIKISYIDRDHNFKEGIAQAQESANHATRGEISSETIDFHGFSNAAVAQRVAAREMRALSYPLAKFTIHAKRKAAILRWGRPFRLTWTPLCLFGMVLRVVSIKSGRLEDGEVILEAYEDIFGIAFTGFGPPAASGWVNPLGDPQPPAAQLALEAPYLLTEREGQGESRFLLAAAVRASGADLGFQVWTDEGAGSFQSAVGEAFAPSGLLVDDYSRTTPALDLDGFVLESGVDLERLTGTDAPGRQRGDNLCLIGNEIISWTDIVDNGDGTFTIQGNVRGALDTLPADHAAGARVWFFSDGAVASTENPYLEDLAGNIRCLPFNARGVVPLMDVDPVPFELQSRALKPYPPGKVKVNGDYWPDGALYENEALLTWRHRHRAQQPPIAQQNYENQASNIEGTYTVEVLVGGIVQPLRTVTGIEAEDPQEFFYTFSEYLEDDPTVSLPIRFRISPVNGELVGTVRITDEFFLVESS